MIKWTERVNKSSGQKSWKTSVNDVEYEITLFYDIYHGNFEEFMYRCKSTEDAGERTSLDLDEFNPYDRRYRPIPPADFKPVENERGVYEGSTGTPFVIGTYRLREIYIVYRETPHDLDILSDDCLTFEDAENAVKCDIAASS